jgi:hypothetical protein
MSRSSWTACSRRCRAKWLSWHYRSQDESLISFSNHHYYESRLSSFPAPLRSGERESRDGYGVSVVRVNGTFNRSGKGKELRKNRIEAEAIVAEIRHRFEAAPHLKREALAVFGGKRMIEAISARLDKAVAWGLENNRLKRSTLGILKKLAFDMFSPKTS